MAHSPSAVHHRRFGCRPGSNLHRGCRFPGINPRNSPHDVGSPCVSLEQYSWFQSDVFFSAMAVIFSILAASITARGGETGKESHEAITGWVFLISASLSILIVSHSPHGLEEIHRLLSSSIIGATATDIWSFSLLTFLTVLLILLLYRKILLFTLDPSMASAIGMKMKIWSLATSAWLGLAVGLSIRASGMLYTFGCLVLPALVARKIRAGNRTRFLWHRSLLFWLESPGLLWRTVMIIPRDK